MIAKEWGATDFDNMLSGARVYGHERIIALAVQSLSKWQSLSALVVELSTTNAAPAFRIPKIESCKKVNQRHLFKQKNGSPTKISSCICSKINLLSKGLFYLSEFVALKYFIVFFYLKRFFV